MKIFVTGASGWIGGALVPELLDAGHKVLALARSEASAQALVQSGVDVRRGSLDDLEVLADAAGSSDGVIHLAFQHEQAFAGQFAAAAATDLQAVQAFGQALAGSDRPLVIASGFAGLSPGTPAIETDVPDLESELGVRSRSERLALDLAVQGVRSASVRLPPTVHGAGDGAFVPYLVQTARRHGASGYIGDGANCWPAVHRADAAHLFRLAVEAVPAGSVLHAVAEQGIPTRQIAQAIGRGLDVPVVVVEPAEAPAHFGWIADFFGLDIQAASDRTRELLDWHPTQQGLLADLRQGHYFDD